MSAIDFLEHRTNTADAHELYGLPKALYRGQMERLIAHAPTISTFISANSALLATKD